MFSLLLCFFSFLSSVYFVPLAMIICRCGLAHLAELCKPSSAWAHEYSWGWWRETDSLWSLFWRRQPTSNPLTPLRLSHILFYLVVQSFTFHSAPLVLSLERTYTFQLSLFNSLLVPHVFFFFCIWVTWPLQVLKSMSKYPGICDWDWHPCKNAFAFNYRSLRCRTTVKKKKQRKTK